MIIAKSSSGRFVWGKFERTVSCRVVIFILWSQRNYISEACRILEIKNSLLEKIRDDSNWNKMVNFWLIDRGR